MVSPSSSSPPPSESSASEALGPVPFPSPRRSGGYHTAQRPQLLSRSAAKRESVMALGSIRHLQYQFAKQGLANKTRPKSSQPLVLAIPGADGGPDVSEVASPTDSDAPASPSARHDGPLDAPSTPSISDPEAARREVDDLLDNVRASWGITPSRPEGEPSEAAEQEDFIATLLASTTQAVRGVQRFLLSVPVDSSPGLLEPRPASSAKPLPHVALSTAARPRPLVAGSSRVPSGQLAVPPRQPESSTHPLAAIRKCSLEVLGCLRSIEARFRLPDTETAVSPPLSRIASRADDQQALVEVDAGSASASDSAAFAPSVAYEYKAGVTLKDLTAECEVIAAWLEEVAKVLQDIHGRRSLRRVASASGSMPSEPPADREDVPPWATLDLSEPAERNIEKAFACLVSYLPPGFAIVPPSTQGTQAFLGSIADGFALCTAFNQALRESVRPTWGFIAQADIEPLAARPASPDPSGGATKARATFRATKNLNAFAAALRLRYSVRSIQASFDASIIAQRGPGWEEALQMLVLTWVEKVGEQVRDELEADLQSSNA